MDKNEIIDAIEARAKSLGIPINKLCSEAGVNISIVSKWKAGVDPRISTIKRLTDTLDRMEAAA